VGRSRSPEISPSKRWVVLLVVIAFVLVQALPGSVAVGSAATDREARSASVDITFGGLAVVRGDTVVVAGLSRRGVIAHPIRMALARYTAAGRLDRRFGAGGEVLADFGAQSDSSARAVAVQPDGRVVAAGRVGVRGSPGGRFALVRYTQTGKLDPSFGRRGKVATTFGSRHSADAYAVAVQPDGKLVAVGVDTANPISGPYHFALARYTRRGNLDRGFGRGGKVVTDFGSRSDGYATAVAIQTDGKLLVAGSTGVQTSALVRYRSSGRLDPSFGKGGRVTARVGYPSAVVAQSDGKIVVVTGGALLRYRGDGSLDPSFGVGGKVASEPGFGAALAIQADGKLVVAGTGEGRCNCEDPRVFMIARWTSDGSPDLSFGRSGKVTTAFRAGATADGVAVVGAGKIVASGTVGGKDFALARYTSSGKLDGSFGSGGKIVTDFGSVWARRR
jgi:uncharacterized delta-60 repeat protein